MANLKTSAQWIKIFGDPSKSKAAQAAFEKKFMELWDVPQEINDAIPCLPNKIYVNYALIAPLESTFRELIALGLHKEFKTWDGAFNVRIKRGTSPLDPKLSVHSWAMAVDFNAAWNKFRGKVSWSKEFLAVWRKNKWICGADWSPASIDGMHFQGDNFI